MLVKIYDNDNSQKLRVIIESTIIVFSREFNEWNIKDASGDIYTLHRAHKAIIGGKYEIVNHINYMVEI